MNKIVELVKFLNDPYLVASVQQFFGIKLIGVINGYEYNQKLKQNGNVFSKDLDNSKLKNEDHILDKNYENFQINKQTKFVRTQDNRKCLYNINNSLFYWFFIICTNMGNEIFYILFIPIISWNFDYKTMYLTAISWSIVMYIGQATKDLIKLPRPHTPPVIKIEEKYLLEYGFPSTHCMAAVNIAFSICFFLFENYNATLYTNLKIYSITIATVICFLVCLSRIYLGMHSFLDVFGGIIYSIPISLIFVKFAHQLDFYLKKSVYYGLIGVLFIILMCVMYPSKKRWSPARADTFLISGVACGILTGISLKYALGIEHIGLIKNFNQNFWSLTQLMLIRSIFGIIIVFLTRKLTKEIVFFFIKINYNVQKSSNQKTQIKNIIESDFLFEIFYYLFCYSNVSFCVVFTSFLVFEKLNFV